MLPSIITFARPRTAAITSGSTSIEPRPWSNCRPPWFDTYTPSTPCSQHRAASSAVAMPFRISGMLWVSLKALTLSQVKPAWWECPVAAARQGLTKRPAMSRSRRE